MDLENIKRGLRGEIEKRKNESYFTFQTNIRRMCEDCLDKLEELEKENAELRNKINELENTYETVYVLTESRFIDSEAYTSVLSYGFTEENKAKEEVDMLVKESKNCDYGYYEVDIRR